MANKLTIGIVDAKSKPDKAKIASLTGLLKKFGLSKEDAELIAVEGDDLDGIEKKLVKHIRERKEKAKK